jgi:hypothetical protein
MDEPGQPIMRERPLPIEPQEGPDPGPLKAVLEAKELRLRILHLRIEVAKRAGRTLLGITPMVLALIPRFRVGAIAWIFVPPLALYVFVQARRTLAGYRELQAARKTLRRKAGSRAPEQEAR